MANWQVVSEHRRTPGGMLHTTWPLLMLGGMSAGFTAMFLWIWASRRSQTDLLIAAGVTAVLALGLLGAAVWKAYLSASPVQVFEEGLLWGQGGRDCQRGWDEVREVYRKELYRLVNGAPPSDWYRHSDLRLVFKDGQQVRFNHSLSDYNRMAEFVLRAAAERVLPEARKELSGPGVGFGPLRLDREGLKQRQQTFAWDALRNIRVVNGNFCWNDIRGKGYSVALKDIPNYLVLLRLIDEVFMSAGKS